MILKKPLDMLAQEELIISELCFTPVDNHLHSVVKEPKTLQFKCSGCGATTTYEEVINDVDCGG